MEFPRINIYLDRIAHNGRIINDRCTSKGISVVAVTKSVLGSTEVARAIAGEGIGAFGDSRVENLKKLGKYFKPGQLMLLRSPMLSEAEEAVGVSETSLNTQIEVVEEINRICAEKNIKHNIIVMAETDDRREGLLPSEVIPFCKKAAGLANINILGLGTNARCISSKKPSCGSLSALQQLRVQAEETIGKKLPVLSGGNSSLYPLIMQGKVPGEINQVRIGEAIMLGHDTLDYLPISGAHRDCFELQAEIIEVRKGAKKAIIALGIQDADASNLKASENDIEVVGQSSDHTVIVSRDKRDFCPGGVISFNMDYFGLLSCMTSPFVRKNFLIGKLKRNIYYK
ncbi:MAG: alanine racemase [Actinomycetota bacterium]